MRTSLVVLLLAFAAALPALAPGDFEDDKDQGWYNNTSVHVCFGNALMRGIDVGGNRFMCSAVNGVGSPAVDPALTAGGTQANIFYQGGGHIVHVCPAGSAMVGWHQGYDWLICAPSPGLSNIHPDLVTQEQEPNQRKGVTMHVCDGNSVMVGISVPDNVLFCANLP